MDPVTAIGLAASIVQLITTTTQTVQYVNQIKNAPKEVGEFGQEASNVLILLWRLRARVDEAKVNKTPSSQALPLLEFPTEFSINCKKPWNG